MLANWSRFKVLVPAATPAAAVSSTTAWAWEYTSFDQCVVFKESGGQSTASNGVDESYYQWLPTTWQGAQRDVGVSFTPDPFQATLAQQTYVFNLWEPGRYPGGISHRGAWPVTVPECGG